MQVSMRHPAVLGLGAMRLAGGIGTTWSAGTYPTGPICLAAKVPKGGSAGALARMLSGRLAPALGQPMVVKTSLAAKSVDERMSYAKTPSGKLNCASSRFGARQHLAGDLPKSAAGSMRSVCHAKGSCGGDRCHRRRVEMTISGLIFNVPRIRSRSVGALSATCARRSSTIPDVPTVAEVGPPGNKPNV